MKKIRYVLNKRTNVLHRLPTPEKCNIDQVPEKYRKRVNTPAVGRLCMRCFSRKEK